ncbi:MAG TPA: Ppx/GppA family phosphatase [Rhizomicrobium sp.]|jgi:exopolyphosphatase/guanosine-5'-triphosphate,3'-diphosphate pyrophosphatase|nr:Ppx/GppA family phosphatase [Rhizomicrobium sp.]
MAPVQTASAGASPLAASARNRAPVAVVDIGSNSVRLVIYDGAIRAPAVLHNEKTICSIGRNMVSTGRLNDDGIVLALASLARFRMLANALNVEIREAVATAAARDAANGAEFVRRAEAAWGGPVRVLSGQEEARLAAEGVLAGIPDADGLVADLGGGSLDMVTVKAGRTGEAITLPVGPLRLMDASKNDPDKARKFVDEGLESMPALGDFSGRALYAVGGAWRSLARVDMVRSDHPLHVLHGYSIPRERALKLCKVISGLSHKSVEKMEVVSKRRAEALPYGALVLERLILAANLKEIVISAYGLREGLLFERLSPEEREKDPLIAFATGMNARLSRNPDHAEELFAWMAPAFAGETAELRRVRHALCLFSDIGWRRHPDDRSLGVFDQVLTAPFVGADHRARALIATAIFHRYSGDEDFPKNMHIADLLDEDDAQTALRLGLAARLGFALSASAAGELKHYRLRVTPQKVILEVPTRREIVAGEPVEKRLAALAATLERGAEFLIG